MEIAKKTGTQKYLKHMPLVSYMKTIITAVLLTLSLAMCQPLGQETYEDINFRYAILQLPTEDLQYISKTASASWLPDTTDLKVAERVIQMAVRPTKGQVLSIQTLPDYVRQYVGFISPAGERMLWVNALCAVLEQPVERNGEYTMEAWPWQKELILVDDGGDCYWSILINLDERTYSNFLVNGNA